MAQSLSKIGTLVLCFLGLTGCVGASDWLSGPSENQNALSDSVNDLAPMRLGVTTREEITSRFGVPDGVQFGSIEGQQIESVSYSSTEPMMTPFQYIPFFGSIEMWRQGLNRIPSVAISFSPEESVSGVTLSSHNAYGDIRSSEIPTRADSPTSFYGLNNPAVFSSPNLSPDLQP